MKYSIKVPSKIQKKIARLPKRVADQVFDRIEMLSTDPRPHDCKKLKARAHFYRIRIGNYRVVYEIQDHKLIIIVIEASHRNNVYNLLKHLS